MVFLHGWAKGLGYARHVRCLDQINIISLAWVLESASFRVLFYLLSHYLEHVPSPEAQVFASLLWQFPLQVSFLSLQHLIMISHLAQLLPQLSVHLFPLPHLLLPNLYPSLFVTLQSHPMITVPRLEHDSYIFSWFPFGAPFLFWWGAFLLEVGLWIVWFLKGA